MGYWEISGLMFLAAMLAAKKTTDDLDAFRPGPPRWADLLVLVVALLMLVVVDTALAPLFEPVPINFDCPPARCIAIPLV